MQKRNRYFIGSKALIASLSFSSLMLMSACGSADAPTPQPPTQETTTEIQSVAQVTTPEPEAQTEETTPVQPVQVTLPAMMITLDLGAPSGMPLNAEGVQVVARVNGQDILLSDLERAVERFQLQQLNVADVATLQASVLETLIDQTLIEQAASAQQLAVTDEEVEAEIQNNIALAGSPEVWAQWLTANQFSEDEYRLSVYETLLTNRVRDALLADLNTSTNVLQTHARHILVSSAELANDIYNRLQNGEDFATLAAQHSIDVTATENGGDLGWFMREELLEPTLGEVAFTQEIGVYSPPFETIMGYHIIQVIERAERPVNEDKVALIGQVRFENWLFSQRSSAVIERFI